MKYQLVESTSKQAEMKTFACTWIFNLMDRLRKQVQRVRQTRMSPEVPAFPYEA